QPPQRHLVRCSRENMAPTRRASAQGYGLVVVSHTPRAIRTQPEVVIADLQRAYQLALQRPRPNVRAVDPGQMSHLAS
ncbi:MAG: hypothetical protein WBB62_09710, partial [Rhodococcus sp. (in: high G+C Gram-positive bacteria)]